MKRAPSSSVIRRRPAAPRALSFSQSEHRLFATTDAGLEDVLARELKQIGARRVAKSDRGVAFAGGLSLIYKANLRLRTAYRVLLELAEFEALDRESLYEGVLAVPWGDHMSPDQTLAVDAVSHGSDLGHTQFISRVVKDGVVDHFRSRVGRRPSVDVAAPDLKLNARLSKNRCTLSIDTSGERLHRRGYRSGAFVRAPLKETLAAGILLKSGFDGTCSLIDPMCGSGTFLIEAALIAKNIAPGLLGRSFGFVHHPSFDRKLYKDLIREARSMVRRDAEVTLVGSDIDREALRELRTSAGGAGVDDLIRARRADIKDLPARSEGMVVTNPPYGARLGEIQELEDLYRLIGDTLKHRCAGMTAHILTGSKFLAKQIGLRDNRRDILFNGPIECRLLHYELY